MRLAAERFWPAEATPTADPVTFTIIHFYDNRVLDVDNLPKPILDALKGLVFQDDAQVTDLICRKRYLRGDSDPLKPSSVLDEGLDRGVDFFYIAIDEASDQEVTA